MLQLPGENAVQPLQPVGNSWVGNFIPQVGGIAFQMCLKFLQAADAFDLYSAVFRRVGAVRSGLLNRGGLERLSLKNGRRIGGNGAAAAVRGGVRRNGQTVQEKRQQRRARQQQGAGRRYGGDTAGTAFSVLRWLDGGDLVGRPLLFRWKESGCIGPGHGFQPLTHLPGGYSAMSHEEISSHHL